MKRELLDLVRGREELAELDPAERRLALRTVAAEALAPTGVATAVGELSDWIDGYGPLTRAMQDPDVTDILVNGPDDVWVERSGHLQRESVRFDGPQELGDLIDRLLGTVGARADAMRPIADARLPDGSRMHVVLPPVAPVQMVSIRKFPDRAYTLDDLVARRFLSQPEATRLCDAVVERKTIAIGGGTGTGKTTLANALLGCVGAHERVVVIEETPELRPVVCAHWVSLLTRPPNIEGRGEIDQSALLRAALRMRPDRIVVGEVRGPEALVALQAMSTGHEGSLVTVHARSAPDVRERLVELAFSAERAPTEESLRGRVARSVDVVVQVGRRAGRRRVVEVLGAG